MTLLVQDTFTGSGSLIGHAADTSPAGVSFSWATSFSPSLVLAGGSAVSASAGQDGFAHLRTASNDAYVSVTNVGDGLNIKLDFVTATSPTYTWNGAERALGIRPAIAYDQGPFVALLQVDSGNNMMLYVSSLSTISGSPVNHLSPAFTLSPATAYTMLYTLMKTAPDTYQHTLTCDGHTLTFSETYTSSVPPFIYLMASVAGWASLDTLSIADGAGFGPYVPPALTPWWKKYTAVNET